MCRADAGLAFGIGLVVLVVLVGAGGIQQEQPPWLVEWFQQPGLIKFVGATVVALIISMVAGSLIVHRFDECVGAKLRGKGDEHWNRAQELHDWHKDKKVPSRLTGYVERLVFTFIAMAHPVGAAAAMGVWLGLKMAVHWNKDVFPKDEEEYIRAKMLWNRYAFLGLLTGFVSMTCAGVGGVVGRLIMGLDAISSTPPM
jgi:hypothetical protein